MIIKQKPNCSGNDNYHIDYGHTHRRVLSKLNPV